MGASEKKRVGKCENVISGRNSESENTVPCFTKARANGMMMGIAKEANWDRGMGYRRGKLRHPGWLPLPLPPPKAARSCLL